MLGRETSGCTPIDLRTCKRGDILISSQGARLKYLRPTRKGEYLDHVVEHTDKVKGKTLGGKETAYWFSDRLQKIMRFGEDGKDKRNIFGISAQR